MTASVTTLVTLSCSRSPDGCRAASPARSSPSTVATNSRWLHRFVVDGPTALLAAQRMRTLLDADVNVEGRILRITGSLGVALEEASIAGVSSSTMVRNAGSALSNAKSSGTGQFRLYDAAMRRDVS